MVDPLAHTFCVAQFQFAFISKNVISYLLCFSVICVSCTKLHKIKLEENKAWMQGQQVQSSNQQEDASSRWLWAIVSMKAAHVMQGRAQLSKKKFIDKSRSEVY